MKLTLHNYWRSSCSYRVRLALAMKGVDYEYVSVNLAPNVKEHFQPAFEAKNVMHQVPVLEIDGRVVTQSVAIIELIDELFPEPALLPKDPFARAQVRRLVEIVNSGTQPLQNPSLAARFKAVGGDADEFMKSNIAAGLTGLEAAAKPSAGRYLVGDEVTIADLFLVPQIYNARRFEVPLDRMPTLVSVDERLRALPAFLKAHPDQMPDAPKKA